MMLALLALLSSAVPASATGVKPQWMLLTTPGARLCPGSDTLLVRKAEAERLIAAETGETPAFCLQDGFAVPSSTARARRRGSIWWVVAAQEGKTLEYFARPGDYLLNPPERPSPATAPAAPPPARGTPPTASPGDALERSLGMAFPDAAERAAVAWLLKSSRQGGREMKEFKADLAAADRPGWERELREKWGPRARRALAQACGELAARRPAEPPKTLASEQLTEWWAYTDRDGLRDAPAAPSAWAPPAGLCPAAPRRETAPRRDTATTPRRDTAPPARRRETAAPPPPATGPAVRSAAQPGTRPGVAPRPSGDDGAWKQTAAMGAGAAALGVAGMLAFGPLGLVGGLLLGGALGWELGKGL